MISIQSIGIANIEKARKNFVNHVYSYTHNRLRKSLEIVSIAVYKNALIDNTVYTSYSNSEPYIINDFTDKDLILKYIADNLYDIIALPSLFTFEENDILKKHIRQRVYFSRISESNKANLNSFSKNRKRVFKCQKEYITSNRKKIDEKINQIKLNSTYCEIDLLLNTIFNYDNLSQGLLVNNYNLYNLSEDLGLRTCPYCNKNYIFAIRDPSRASGKLVNATMDHWLPKSKYPWLQISFYNLIPSCSNCNSSIKRVDNFTHETHLNPYLAPAHLTSLYSFDYYKTASTLPVVTVTYKDSALGVKLKNTFNAFEIEKLYNAHSLELHDMINLSEEYSEPYLESLQKISSLSTLNKEKAYNMLFNTSTYDEHHHQRPLSKFRYDILKKLKVIQDQP